MGHTVDRFENKSVSEIQELLKPDVSSQERQNILTDLRSLSGPANPNIIDPKQEVADVAALFLKKYPNALMLPVSARDLQSYRAAFDSRFQRPYLPMEMQVERIVEALKKPGASHKIVVSGEEFDIRNGDVSAMLNNQLDQEGSQKRVFIVPTSANGRIADIVFGSGTDKIVELNGSRKRLITMTQIDFISTAGSELAVNNGVSTIITLDPIIERSFTQVAGKNVFSELYRNKGQVIQQQVFRNSKLAPEFLEAASDVIENHEYGHFKIQDVVGMEFQILMRTLSSQGIYSLVMMTEVYADLFAVEDMIQLAASDPDQAARQFNSFAILRSGLKESSPHQKATHYLLMSCTRLENGKVVIDWKQLQNKTATLKQMYRASYQELTNNLVFYALYAGGVPQDQLTRMSQEGRKAQYEQLVQSKAEEIEREKQYDPVLARREAVSALVGDGFRVQVQQQGRQVPILDLLRGTIDKSARSINVWYSTQLSIPPTLLPFPI